MRLPDLVAYQAAVQHPSTAFADPQLRTATVATGRLGLPRAVTGNFAVTYQLRSGTRHWAVRCFHREAADRAPRYAAISQSLARMSSGPLVPIEYIDSGVRVGQTWFPITKMAWIDGHPLNHAVEGRLTNPPALKDLEQRFITLVANLQAHGFAHGDLQHGNILVDPAGALHLVDYDGMFVPGLRGRTASESGDPNYQHPRRTVQFDAELDRFAALVIVIGLRALAVAPWLWKTYNTGDNLLFRRADFANPATSALFRDLAGLPAVRDLSDRLAMACREDYARVPRLDDVLKLVTPHIAQPVRTQKSWKLRRAGIQQAITFSSDAALLATVDCDGKVTVRETATGRTRRSARLADASGVAARVAFGRGGGLLVAVPAGATMTVWDADSRHCVRELTAGGRSLYSIALSSGGGWLAAASRDGTVRCWSLANGRLAAAFAQPGPLVALAVSADGRHLATANPRGQVRICRVSDGQPVSVMNAGKGITSLAFRSDAQHLAIGTSTGSLTVWDVAAGDLALNVATLDEPIESVAVSPDGKSLAVTGRDGSIWLRKMPAQRARRQAAASPARLIHARAGVIESSYRLFDWLRRVALL